MRAARAEHVLPVQHDVAEKLGIERRRVALADHQSAPAQDVVSVVVAH